MAIGGLPIKTICANGKNFKASLFPLFPHRAPPRPLPGFAFSISSSPLPGDSPEIKLLREKVRTGYLCSDDDFVRKGEGLTGGNKVFFEPHFWPNTLATARMCSGDVPQQPPTRRAPARKHWPMPAAKDVASISYTVTLSANLGFPALGFAKIGSDVDD